MSNVHWWKIKNQSLAIAVRNVGFDLTVYDDYKMATQKEVKRLAISESLRILREEFWEETELEIDDIKRGVYVICLSRPFAIQYEKGLSEIIYIGRGNVVGRLRSHYERSLFRFMRSLSGTNFDFYISEPKKKGPGRAKNYYKHVEYSLLDTFRENIGGGKYVYPLLNSNAGTNVDLQLGKSWDKPLSRKGKKPTWVLEPTKFWDFEKLD